jgi:hypothetical protein
VEPAHRLDRREAAEVTPARTPRVMHVDGNDPSGEQPRQCQQRKLGVVCKAYK